MTVPLVITPKEVYDCPFGFFLQQVWTQLSQRKIVASDTKLHHQQGINAHT